MIVLNNIVKTFSLAGQTFQAVDDITLRVPPGKVCGVIGSSGAGKSTLIRCVNLLERPDSGQVMVGGRDLLTLSSKELAKARREIGMIFQHFNLLTSRTVFENVALPLELAGLSKREIQARVGELLELVGLSEKASDYPSSLSGGQKQRVAIARTLAPNPKVLLCDEATSALDPSTTRSILKLLKEINRNLGITILLITHEMEVVKAICDEVVVVDQGRVVEKGPVSELFSRPQSEVTRRFLEDIARFEIPAEYESRLKLEFEQSHALVKLEFSDLSNDIAVLSELYRLYQVSGNIVSAQMECNNGVKFGTMLLELAGDHLKQSEAVGFLKHNHIETEVIGYV